MNVRHLKHEIVNADGSVRVVEVTEPLRADPVRSPLLQHHQDVFVPRCRNRRRKAIERKELPENARKACYPVAAPVVDVSREYGEPFCLYNENERVLRDKMKWWAELQYPELIKPDRPNRFYLTCSLSMLAEWLKWSKSKVARTMTGLIEKRIAQPYSLIHSSTVPRRGRFASGANQRHTTYVLPEYSEVLAALRDDPKVIVTRVPVGANHHVVHVYGNSKKLVTRLSPPSMTVCLDEETSLREWRESAKVDVDATSVQVCATEPADPSNAAHLIDTLVLAVEVQAGSVHATHAPNKEVIPFPESLEVVPSAAEPHVDLSEFPVDTASDPLYDPDDPWSELNLEVALQQYCGIDDRIPWLIKGVRDLMKERGRTITNEEIFRLCQSVWVGPKARQTQHFPSWWMKAIMETIEGWLKAKEVDEKKERVAEARRREEFVRSVEGAYEAHDTVWLAQLREMDREATNAVVARLKRLKHAADDS